MTSQQQADEALQAYWAAKKLLDQFFNFPTREEFSRQMSCVHVEFPCVITSSASSSLSSAASSLVA